MEELKPCPFGNERCLCRYCLSNAMYDDCEKGYCVNCIECEDARDQKHDVYLCIVHESRMEHPHGR